ncbi:hypothetical protein [Desulfitobacterium sp.]|uniref:hypothetical protein n=1 Tax=Desulfitobacterium sp. TaxID=49981 RepID=UPI002D14C72E|nr:hypothetical protein [Desulfitobacterium sp.]HVJ50663.1 hypothetical protein [Desulfitobacterium sp.]
MKKNKSIKYLFIVVLTLMLNFVLAGNVFATDVFTTGYTYHQGWSPNWGYKAYNVNTYYTGNQYEQSGYQYVDGHDYLVWISSSYSPEISRGAAQLGSLQMLNTSDSAVSTLYQSSFSPGSYRSFYLDPNATYLVIAHSYSWLTSYSGTYRAKVNTIYVNCDFTGMDGTDSYYTPYF